MEDDIRVFCRTNSSISTAQIRAEGNNTNPVPMQIAIGAEEDFKGVVDLISLAPNSLRLRLYTTHRTK
jgi:hypothetical protein